MALGLLGKKLGMTQLADGDQGRVGVTLIEIGPCLVIAKKTKEKDGYTAVKMAFGARKPKHTAKAQMKIYETLKTTPRRFMREFRVSAEELGALEIGQEINMSQVFKEGQRIDVSGKTKGRGFTGVIKKWGFKGNRRSHGTHEFFRHGGSIGTRTWPGNVQKGKKMGGHYGDERVTTSNLRIVKMLAEKNCIVLEGSVPGANNGLLEIRPSRN